MKNILVSMLTVFLLSACTSPVSLPFPKDTNEGYQKETDDNTNNTEQKLEMEDDHLGCQEGEIVNGECRVAEEGKKNLDLFANLDSLNIKAEEVLYAENIHGFLAQPQEPGMYPGIVMIHEWWGLNENIRDMARLLANEGYVVLAVDLYGGEVTETSDRARELATTVRENPETAVSNMQSAVSFLRNLPNVEKEKIASLGWCFGGQQSLNLALASTDLAATILYYGELTNDKELLQKIHWPVMGVFGDQDTNISVESVKAFSDALHELSIPNDIYMYVGVGHAFANPSGSQYAPKEALDAWNKTLAFLGKNLKGDGAIESSKISETSEVLEKREITVEMFNFGFSPNVLEAHPGETIRIHLINTQGMHDFVIDELGIASTLLQTGEDAFVEVSIPEKNVQSEYAFYCSIGNHRENGMEGVLKIVEQEGTNSDSE